LTGTMTIWFKTPQESAIASGGKALTVHSPAGVRPRVDTIDLLRMCNSLRRFH